jgi:hypothetical protein
VHYVATVTARAPIDLAGLGHVYALTIGHPTASLPRGPQCGQKAGPVQTITAEVRLDRATSTGGGVFGPPPTGAEPLPGTGVRLGSLVGAAADGERIGLADATEGVATGPAQPIATTANVRTRIGTRGSAARRRSLVTRPS